MGTVKKVEDSAAANIPGLESTVTDAEATPVEHMNVQVDDSVSAEDNKKDELVEEAVERGLDTSGTKQELADRINEHDEAGVHKPEVLYPTVGE